MPCKKCEDFRDLLEKKDPRAKKPVFLLDTTEGVDMKKGFTLVLCFSRRWCIVPFFEAFDKLRIPVDDCHLLIFCNSDSPLLERDLLVYAERYRKVFKTVRMYQSYRRGRGTMSNIPSDPDHRGKLPYIYAMYLDIIDLVTTEVFINLEDDTTVPSGAVMRLLSIMEENNNRAFVTGIETNRGPYEGVKTRLGVHYIKREGNRIIERLSLDPDTRGVVPVDACGWYCCASTPEIWKLGFEGVEKYFWEIPRFALDMFHTNNLKLAGIPVLADFGTWCKHMEGRNDKIIYWGKKQAVPMADIWLPKYKTYAQGVVLGRGKACTFVK